MSELKISNQRGSRQRLRHIQHDGLIAVDRRPRAFSGPWQPSEISPSGTSCPATAAEISERSDGVYHSRRPAGIHRSFDDSGALQFTELLGEGSLRDSGLT